MLRSSFVVVVFSLGLVVGCGGSGTTSQTDGPLQSDAGAGDGAQHGDGALPADGALPSDGAAQTDGSAPASHTENNGGVMHLPGKGDPLVNCVACHGATLQGGTGPSCYTCHNNDDHTITRGGKKHLAGSSSTCNACHGPNNGGGLGPACSECH